MKTEFRIVKREKGYVVQNLVVKWYLFRISRKWITYIYDYVIPVPRYYSNYRLAMEDLLSQVKRDTNFNSKFKDRSCPITGEITIKNK